MKAGSCLNLESRQAAIEGMQRGPLDVLIIGGGITGSGAALDAAARGLTVGLIEQADLASGSSSKSSKMIHGGLRYLEQLRFELVRQALQERALLLNVIAPHLVKPVPFLFPLRHRLWERAYVGAGVFLYDRLAGADRLPSGRHLTRSATARLAPGLRRDQFVGGIQFWDAQEDDARYVVFVARTAAAYGAKIATRVSADDLVIRDGTVVGVRATDRESGRELEIRARHVVTATGAWTGRLPGSRTESGMRTRPSKGVHILLPRSAIDLETGLIARTDRGLLFIIPWEGQWLVGDTDADWPYDPADALPEAIDLTEIMYRLNSLLATKVSPQQILGVFAGLRPLVAADADVDTKELSREHIIESPIPGLTVICGGKYTTYRKMAADLIDVVGKSIGPSSLPPSSTARIPLIGADGFRDLLLRQQALATELGLDVSQTKRLLGRYGGCTEDLLALIRKRPDLGRPLAPDTDVLRVEIVYACGYEGALHVDDALERRTRLALRTPDGGVAVVGDAARLIGQELGWPEERTRAEVERYVDLRRKERAGLERVRADSSSAELRERHPGQTC